MLRGTMAKRLQLQSCRKGLLLVGCNQKLFLPSVQTFAVAHPDASRKRAIPVCVTPTVEEFVDGCYKVRIQAFSGSVCFSF